MPAYYLDKPVRWQLNLTSTGQLASPQLIDRADPTDKALKFGGRRAVPYVTRTSAAAPCLGTDTIEYVLGWTDDPARQAKAGEYTEAFQALLHAWAAADPAEPAAAAAAAFFASGDVRQILQPAQWARSDLVQVAVDGSVLADLPGARSFWQTEAERRKSGGQQATQGICLVCGTVDALLDTLPQQLNKNTVPLAAQNPALVSANKRIHTYDHTDGLATTIPICVDCGRRAVNALTHVLTDGRSHLQLGDTRLAWWTVGADPVDLIDTLAVDDPESVASLVERVRRTATPATTGLEPERFCALALAGNVARVMIRDWVDMPLAALERNVAAWFVDHQITSPYGRSGYQPLWLLALAAGRSIKNGERREYAAMDAKAGQRPNDIGRALLRAALLNKPLPASLLAHLVTRIRTDGHLDDPRAALLRLALTRTPHPTKETPMPGLDPDNHGPAYISGRIFAALENLQSATTSRDATVNATFSDRYFAGAVANPRVALVQGRQLAAAWLKKLRRTNGGLAALLDRQLTDLFDLLEAGDGIPGRIEIGDQAAFLLGYHHQRADSLRSRIAASEARKVAADSSDNQIHRDTERDTEPDTGRDSDRSGRATERTPA